MLGTTSNIFAVEGRLDDPAHKRVFVPAEQAAQTPVEQSDRKLLAANQIISRERALAQQEELLRGVGNPNRSGPVMAM